MKRHEPRERMEKMYRDEYLASHVGEPEREKRIEALIEKVLADIDESGLSIEEIDVFFKLLGVDIEDHKEELLRTVPFVILPGNLQVLPCSDQQIQLASRLSEALGDQYPAHI